MHTLKTVVVDDYQPDIDQLVHILSSTCPQVKVIEKYPVKPESLEKIDAHIPDLVFFNVKGSNDTGLELLNGWETAASLNVVLTADDTYYLDSLVEAPISDVLNKPFCPKKLSEVVNKVRLQTDLRRLHNEFNCLKKTVLAYVQPKISIPTLQGLECVETKDIIYIEAADNYAVFYLTNGSQIVSSQSLRKLQGKLSYLPFIRIHRSFLANQNHICKYLKGDGGQVLMSNQKYLNVARNRKDALIEKLIS